MGLFCGKKCKCKRRCKGYFATNPDLERGCSKACDSDSGMNKERYLCSGQWINEQDYIADYGTDPCPDYGYEVGEVLDPFNTRGYEEDKMERLKPIFLGLGIIIIGALLVLYIVKR